jgi:uncharacterized iron-regulated membrane protein
MTDSEAIVTFRVLSDVGIAQDVAIVGWQGWEKGNYFIMGCVWGARVATGVVVGCVFEKDGKGWAWADVAKGNPIKEGFAHSVGGIMESIVRTG